MTILLSDELKEFVEHEVEAGAFASVSEYMNQLIEARRDDVELQEKIIEGLASPLSDLTSEEIHAQARQIARGYSAD